MSKGWDGSDGLLHRPHTTWPTAWVKPYKPDCWRGANRQLQSGIPDIRCCRRITRRMNASKIRAWPGEDRRHPTPLAICRGTSHPNRLSNSTRWTYPEGVSSDAVSGGGRRVPTAREVPNIPTAGMIGKNPMVRLPGHRPMVQTSPAGRMDGMQRTGRSMTLAQGLGGLPGRRTARPGGSHAVGRLWGGCNERQRSSGS